MPVYHTPLSKHIPLFNSPNFVKWLRSLRTQLEAKPGVIFGQRNLSTYDAEWDRFIENITAQGKMDRQLNRDYGV